MTLAADITEEIELPQGITATVDSGKVTVKGPKGELSKSFDTNGIVIASEKGKVTISREFPKQKEKALMGSIKAHIKNMVRGVTEGFEYRLRVHYSHFPMNVSVQGDKVIIKNFLGEKYPRQSQIVGSAKVTVKGQDITVQGVDKEDVGQTAANMVLATKIGRKDPRIFQDGIFILDKGGEAE